MTDETRRDGGGRRQMSAKLYVVIGIVAIVLLGAAAWVFFWTSRSDDASPTSTTVSSGGVVLPQNPSLNLLQVDGTWYVENDGNVTMSGVAVRDGSDSVICELGTLSPDARAACEAAGAADDLSAFGLGPQGQEVVVGSN